MQQVKIIRFSIAFSLFMLFLLQAPTSPQKAHCEQMDKSSSQDEVPKESSLNKGSDEKLALILNQMESAYEKMEDYEAEFKQESKTKTLQRRKKSMGRLYFKKPDKMRWSYLEPEPRDIYLTGKEMMIYLPLRNTVIKQSLKDVLPGTAPAQLFMGGATLKKTFEITLANPDLQKEGSYCLKLIPKKKGKMSVEEILLWIGTKDYLPRKSESSDILGNITKLYFFKGKTNVKLDKGIFEFKPPPDTEIVENTF